MQGDADIHLENKFADLSVENDEIDDEDEQHESGNGCISNKTELHMTISVIFKADFTIKPNNYLCKI